MIHEDQPREFASSVAATWRRTFDYAGTASRRELAYWGAFCAATWALAATLLPHWTGAGSIMWFWLRSSLITYAWDFVPETLGTDLDWQRSLPFLGWLTALILPTLALFVRRLRDAGHSPWHVLWFPLLLTVWSRSLLLPDVYPGSDALLYVESLWGGLASVIVTGGILAGVYLCSRAGSGDKLPAPFAPGGWLASLVHSLRLYADFRGRASRREWWIWFWSSSIALLLACVWVTSANAFFECGYGPIDEGSIRAIRLADVWLMPAFWALCVRRLHDVGKSARPFALWLALPLAFSWVDLYVSTLVEDEWLRLDHEGALVVSVVTRLAVYLVVWLPAWVVAARKGEPVANIYGPPPQSPTPS